MTGITAATTSNDTRLATTEFVKAVVTASGGGGGGGGGSATLSTFRIERDAYYGGVAQGNKFLKNGIESIVMNQYRPEFTFTNVSSIFSTTPHSSFTAMTGTQEYTIEAWIYPLFFKCK